MRHGGKQGSTQGICALQNLDAQILTTQARLLNQCCCLIQESPEEGGAVIDALVSILQMSFPQELSHRIQRSQTQHAHCLLSHFQGEEDREAVEHASCSRAV